MKDASETVAGSLTAPDGTYRPTYVVPSVIVGVILFFTTLFGGTFAVLPLVIEDAHAALTWGAVAGVLLVLLSWWWAVSVWRSRMRLSGCCLILDGDGVRPDVPCSFTIENRKGTSVELRGLRFFLSYQDRLRRRGGRKVYLRGPFTLDVDVETREAPEMQTRADGRFVIKTGQVKPRSSDENWHAETIVILRMKVPGTGKCMFELPYITTGRQVSQTDPRQPGRQSVVERMLGARKTK